MPTITAISTSTRKGVRKNNIASGLLLEGFGIENDAHGGDWHRQISLLAEESIEFMRQKGLDVVAGNFAENLTTSGIDLTKLTVGRHLQIGTAELILSQLGKICHNRCAIFHQAGDCVMPREGVFGIVHRGGTIHVGDSLSILEHHSDSAAIIATAAAIADIHQDDVAAINTRLNTAFTRLDVMKTSGENLHTILLDLNNMQHITHIFFYDPSGEYKGVFDQEEVQENLLYCTKKEILTGTKL